MNKKILLDGLKSLGIFGGIFILFYIGINLLSEDKKKQMVLFGRKNKPDFI
jgi:hypothetical protein